MEIDGHPTHDLVEELERRGAVRMDGSASGPNTEALRFVTDRVGDLAGLWLFLPREAFETGFDEPPN